MRRMQIVCFPKMKGVSTMKESFGITPEGKQAFLYTLRCGQMSACISDYGATLVRLLVPDARGDRADVVLGYDDVSGYAGGQAFLGATVGRCANRIGKASFVLGRRTYSMTANEGKNNLHSGPDYYHNRLWQVAQVSENAITLRLDSPDGDQGFPGNAHIQVCYTLEPPSVLRIRYEAVCDKDTVFNLTNHSYFNLAGHDHPERAMEQILILPARSFTPADGESIPTGEVRPVEGTPMDFRTPKAIGRDLTADYEPLKLQGGYDHNFEVFSDPCAVLTDPVSGRSLAISTDCPGLQFYAGNNLAERGKNGVFYGKNSGVALETQFYPDALHHPQWKQPITPAGVRYCSETRYRFR